MGPQTYHLMVTVHPSGHSSVLQWRSDYTSKRRQVPEWLGNEFCEDGRTLSLAISEFTDFVLQARLDAELADDSRQI